jgi:hypothetical protein
MDRLERDKHERYSALRAQGAERADAYGRVYGKPCLEAACRLERRGDVKARIATLKLGMTRVGEAEVSVAQDPAPLIDTVDVSIDVSGNVSDVSEGVSVPSVGTMLEHISNHRAIAMREMAAMATAEVALEDVQPRDKIIALRAWLDELREMDAECRRQMAEAGDDAVAAGYYNEDAMQLKATEMLRDELIRVKEGEVTVDELIAECESEVDDGGD